MEDNSFNIRYENGNEAIIFFDQEMSVLNIDCIPIFLNEEWETLSNCKKRILREMDKKYGDRIVNDKFTCDVKRSYISLESLKKFEGNFFVLFTVPFSTETCMIFKPEDLKELNFKNYVPLRSGDPGFLIVN